MLYNSNLRSDVTSKANEGHSRPAKLKRPSFKHGNKQKELVYRSKIAQRAKQKVLNNGFSHSIAFKQKIIYILTHSLHESSKLHTADSSIEDSPLVGSCRHHSNGFGGATQFMDIWISNFTHFQYMREVKSGKKLRGTQLARLQIVQFEFPKLSYLLKFSTF